MTQHAEQRPLVEKVAGADSRWFVCDLAHIGYYLRRNGEWKLAVGPASGPDSGFYDSESDAQAALDRWRAQQLDAAADDTTADDTVRVLNQIQADMKADVTRDEGLEFNGRNVARSLGEIRAAVSALARILATDPERLRGAK